MFARYPIKLNDFETVLEGMEDDLYPVRNENWEELRSYCYKVASAVGLILIEIYGYEDRAARLHAIDLGIQMQLINVLRDINEDMERGRIYLPLDIMASHNITPDMLRAGTVANSLAWKGFMVEYVDVIKRSPNLCKPVVWILRRASEGATRNHGRRLYLHLERNRSTLR